MAPSPAGSATEMYARMLGTGQFSDFTIVCGSVSFKAHRIMLAAKSDYFRRLCGSSFKEGIEACINLPEDDPSLVARLLTYIYTDTYSTKSLTKSLPRVELDQFKNVTDNFETPDRGDWQDMVVLHAHMYAMGDKYSVCNLPMMAKIRFLRRLYDEDDPDDYRGDNEQYDVREEDEEYSDSTAKANDKIIREVYTLPLDVVRDLRMIIVTLIQSSIESCKALESKVLRKSIDDIASFASDIAIFRRSRKESRCTECDVSDRRLFGECACGTVTGCRKEACRNKWKDASFCENCQVLGKVEYPELDTEGD